MMLVLAVSAILIAHSSAAPEVQLEEGLIRGREAYTPQQKLYYAFEKVPYAAPPVGDLRFRAPVAHPGWDGTLETTTLDVGCYQQNANTDWESEDCLYLNIFTPQLPGDGTNSSLPVMFFIHGGAFLAGSAIGAHSDALVSQDVILVAINYRLGPFGFLSTEDEVIPGNNGLKDQLFAMQWVHKNIALFGGDPEQITIFGQSAGAASVGYQLLNQNSRGLYKSAILQSGTALCPFAYQRNARSIAFATTAYINRTFYTNNNSSDLRDFLITVDAKTLDTASEKYTANMDQMWQGYFWAPVIEVKNPDAFITRKMYSLMKAGNVVDVPILIGMTSEEAVAFYSTVADFESYMSFVDTSLPWIVPNDMLITDNAAKIAMGEKIREVYTGGEPFADHLGDGIRYSTDTSIGRPAIKHAELYSNYAPTYFYQFSYDGQLGNLDIHYDGAGSVGHSEDMPYLFWGDISSYPEADQIAAQRLIKIWTDFAKFQNPTPEPSELLQNVTWPLVSTENGDFLYVDIGENLEVKNHPKEDTYSKWVDLYDSLGYDDFDSY